MRIYRKVGLVFAVIILGGFAAAQQGQTSGTKVATEPFPAIEVRYLAGDAINSYLASRLPLLSMQGRMLDPFGRFQDPNYRPPEPETGNVDTPDAAPVRPLTLSEIVSAMPVSMVKPSQKTFYVVGGRQFFQGQIFPIKVSDSKEVKVEVVSVSSDRITFRDVAKNEIGVYHMGGTPAGVSRGNTLEPTPGITLPNPSAPLDLQPSEVPPPNR